MASSRVVQRFLLYSALAVLLAHLVDWWAAAHLALPKLANTDLGRLLRIQGFLPTWMIVGGALVLVDWPLRTAGGVWAALRRGTLVMVSAALSGALGELLKILIRRQRPGPSVGEYVFRDWADRPLSTAGLGLPSSHVIVAFGALAMLGLLFPRARPVCYALAAGCAFSRVAAHAHFVSDVTLAAVIGIATAWLLWRRFPAPATP
ncbi:MAG TPA: phosphatase PAP2 family protein [Gemmatimonadales bacterium]|nr:phosphatase PAP2 family protein [Gemmatimonadales bacterium]